MTVLWIKKIVDPKTGIEKPVVISVDDGIRPNTNIGDLAKLKPAFRKDGSTTAGIDMLTFNGIQNYSTNSCSSLYLDWPCIWILGNASQISDGAGAVLLMKRSVAVQKGFPILGVFRFPSCLLNSTNSMSSLQSCLLKFYCCSLSGVLLLLGWILLSWELARLLQFRLLWNLLVWILMMLICLR